MPSKTLKTTTAAAVLALGLLASQPANAADDTFDSAFDNEAFTFGVIGDMPYGDSEIAKFPSRIQDINADSALKFVAHVGDIKNGSSVCSDEYFAKIRSEFDTFEHPLVFTPGDNEWVDCHRTNNGAYNPLERLAKLREVFFDEPGKTLGTTTGQEPGDPRASGRCPLHPEPRCLLRGEHPGQQQLAASVERPGRNRTHA
jgi:hypothetical protein